MRKLRSLQGLVRFSLSVTSAKASPLPNARAIQRTLSTGVARHSWGAENLEQQGEKLAVTDREQALLTDEMMEETPEHIKELADEVLRLNVMDLRVLLDTMQSRLGIDDDQLNYGGGGGGGGGGAQAAGGAAEAAEEVKEKDAFDVKLQAFDAKSKLKIIKEVRAFSDLSLKEAKELVESAPSVMKSGMSKEDAEKLAKTLTDLGATVEVV